MDVKRVYRLLGVAFVHLYEEFYETNVIPCDLNNSICQSDHFFYSFNCLWVEWLNALLDNFNLQRFALDNKDPFFLKCSAGYISNFYPISVYGIRNFSNFSLMDSFVKNELLELKIKTQEFPAYLIYYNITCHFALHKIIFEDGAKHLTCEKALQIEKDCMQIVRRDTISYRDNYIEEFVSTAGKAWSFHDKSESEIGRILYYAHVVFEQIFFNRKDDYCFAAEFEIQSRVTDFILASNRNMRFE